MKKIILRIQDYSEHGAGEGGTRIFINYPVFLGLLAASLFSVLVVLVRHLEPIFWKVVRVNKYICSIHDPPIVQIV